MIYYSATMIVLFPGVRPNGNGRARPSCEPMSGYGRLGGSLKALKISQSDEANATL